jgi:pilus assembly protein CpaE
MAGRITVAIVGGRDRQLEAQLRVSGVEPTSIRVDDLAELSHPSSVPPDVVVLDLRVEQELPVSLAALKRHHPNTAVIVVTDTLDAKLMLEAMRSGVGEYVTDLAGGDLEAAIVRLVAQRAAPEAGDVFAFIGAKGGVGTTTSAVNVAVALSKVASTLLIDLHLAGGDASVFFGVESRFSVADALENTHRLDAAYFRSVVTRTKAGPDLLAASERPVPGTTDVAQIRALIDFAARHYRYTVLDLSSFDPITLDSLGSATAIILITTQELPAVRSSARLSTMLKGRYGKAKVYVMLGRLDEEAEISREDVSRAVGGSVLAALPEDRRTATSAVNRGRPLVLDNHNPLADAFQTCARRLARLGTEDTASERPTTPAQRPGLLGRFGGRK